MHYEVPMIPVVAGGAVCADAARWALKDGCGKPSDRAAELRFRECNA
jgi:hypothetical protein